MARRGKWLTQGHTAGQSRTESASPSLPPPLLLGPIRPPFPDGRARGSSLPFLTPPSPGGGHRCGCPAAPGASGMNEAGFVAAPAAVAV